MKIKNACDNGCLRSLFLIREKIINFVRENSLNFLIEPVYHAAAGWTYISWVKWLCREDT